MKKLIALLLAVCLALPLAACGASHEASASSEGAETASYQYEYQGMMGPEVAQFDLASDGSCRFFLPENPIIRDVYVGRYTREGDTVTITGLSNEDASAEHADPGLWAWITEGGTIIELDDAAGTFAPVQTLPDAEEGAIPDQGAQRVAYASNSASQVCDIYLPEGEGEKPVILLVHGGGFAFGDPKMPLIQPVIEAALARGYAVVSVDYRKSGEAVFPAALADVKAAVRFIKANAAEYGFDAQRIAVWGESAGAYLSLMTALTPEVAELNGDVTDWADQSSAVQALVSFYAPVEFYTLYQEAGNPAAATDSFESKFLGSDITADKELTYTTYWETYADQLPSEMWALIQAGDADQKVPCTQSENFAERLAGYLGEGQVTFELIEGADHEDAAFYTEENLNKVLDWLDSVIKE